MSSLPISGSAPFDSGGAAFRVVEALKEYKRPLPLEFVARLVGLPQPLIREVVGDLQNEKIVVVDAENNVRLEGQNAAPSGFFEWLTR